MKTFIREAMTIARRDFFAVVATPTFALFLLAPIVMVLFAVLGGTGAAGLKQNQIEKTRIVALVDRANMASLKQADADLRALQHRDGAVPQLELIIAQADPAKQAKALIAAKGGDVRAIMYGPLDRPIIRFVEPSRRHGLYLGALAESVLQGPAKSRPTITPLDQKSTAQSSSGRDLAALLSVVVIFTLTLMLGSQSVGMLAEEKTNKVIDILAAAVRLEAVFVGKLLGTFAIALVFIAFWATLALNSLQFIPNIEPLTELSPAVGLQAFFVLGLLYFTMAFMLLGSVFLGVGAQAGSMREIQMLSLPVTLFQVAMFSISTSAASDPGGRLARFAEWFPFSSPFAMMARAAHDAALWPHVLALLWQAVWLAIVILVAVRLFRSGVLKTGGPSWAFWKRKATA